MNRGAANIDLSKFSETRVCRNRTSDFETNLVNRTPTPSPRGSAGGTSGNEIDWDGAGWPASGHKPPLRCLAARIVPEISSGAAGALVWAAMGATVAATGSIRLFLDARFRLWFLLSIALLISSPRTGRPPLPSGWVPISVYGRYAPRWLSIRNMNQSIARREESLAQESLYCRPVEVDVRLSL